MPPFLAAVEGEALFWVAVVALLVVSLGVHEAAHAWVAWKRGDSTGRDLGRMTLNPIPHIDPLMTIGVPLLLIFFNAPFLFGGAKPVPVNVHRLKHPLRDMMLVAVAGPLSNFIQAAFYLLLYKLLVVEYGVYALDSIVANVLWATVSFNLVLTAFNLLPIPPLDGSRVMAWILPATIREPYVRLERMGMIIVVLLLVTGVIRPFIYGSMELLRQAIEGIVTLGGLW